MGRSPQKLIVLALWLCGGTLHAFASPPGTAASAATIRHISVLGAGKNVELEITASQPVNPTAQEVKNPERLVIDFPDAIPAGELRNVAVNRGDVKAVRVGLLTKNPPVTRVVIDLETAQKYQLFPSGKSVIVKLSALVEGKELPQPAASLQLQPAALAQSQPAGLARLQSSSNLPAIATISYAPAAKRIAPQAQPAAPKPQPKVEVEYANGRLRIRTNSKANLSEILYEVHRRTGADIPIPAGAEQEQVVTDIPPSVPRDAVAMLLNGSHFNFIIVGADGDPSKLKRVILTPKGVEGTSQPIIYTGNTPPVESTPDLPEPAQAEAPVSEQPPVEQPVADQPPNQQPANAVPAQVQPDMIPNIPPDQPADGPPQ
jgi:hypothetical protein